MAGKRTNKARSLAVRALKKKFAHNNIIKRMLGGVWELDILLPDGSKYTIPSAVMETINPFPDYRNGKMKIQFNAGNSSAIFTSGGDV